MTFRYALLDRMKEQARREEKVFFNAYTQCTFTPDALDQLNDEGRFRWGPDNWKLVKPKGYDWTVDKLCMKPGSVLQELIDDGYNKTLNAMSRIMFSTRERQQTIVEMVDEKKGKPVRTFNRPAGFRIVEWCLQEWPDGVLLLKSNGNARMVIYDHRKRIARMIDENPLGANEP